LFSKTTTITWSGVGTAPPAAGVGLPRARDADDESADAPDVVPPVVEDEQPASRLAMTRRRTGRKTRRETRTGAFGRRSGRPLTDPPF
jgi:hypothetical protein